MRTENFEIRQDSLSRTPQGFLIVDGYITRSGIFPYYDKEAGKTISELRPPEEVIKQDSLNTIPFIPITSFKHPGIVTLRTMKTVEKGHVGEAPVIIKQDDEDYIKIKLVIKDEQTAKLIENGTLTELSCGYTCITKNEQGVYKGQRYDSVQKNISYNHVTLLPKGRARGGSKVKIKLDEYRFDSNEMEEENSIMKIVINGIEFEVENKTLGQAIETKMKQDEADIANVKKELETIKAQQNETKVKLDETEDKLKKQASIDIEKLVSERADAKIAVINKAQPILNKKFDELIKFDTKKLKEETVKAVNPDIKLDESDENYLVRLDAMFDLLGSLKTSTKNNSNKAFLESVVQTKQDENDFETSIQKAQEKQKVDYDKPLGLCS